MGAPKKPTQLKIVQGTDKRNKTRMNPDEPIPDRGIGDAPAHLSKRRQAIWDEVVGISYPGVLGEADRIGLEMMARLIYTMRFNDNEMTAAMFTQLSQLIGRFGMTPSDRTKIVVKKAKPKNEFGDL